jgi:hypothetical protein
MGRSGRCCCCSYYSYNFDGLVPGDVVGKGVGTLAAANLCLAGPSSNSCASEYTYDAGFQSDLLTWITAGGRLFLTADNVTCFNLVYPNRTDFNNLLGYLGSAMQLTTNFPFGCPETGDCADATAASIGIMNSLPDAITYKQGGEISGGTPLAYTSTAYIFNGCDVPHVLMAAEEIGDGLIVACASSYLTDCDTDGIYEFLRRLCNWPIADIMAV